MGSPGVTLYGRILARVLCQRIKAEVVHLSTNFGVFPKLAVIQVGNQTESLIYIERKQKLALQCGVELRHIQLPSDCSEDMLLEVVHRFNVDPAVHGVMIQLPLDSLKPIDVARPLQTIVAEKDVEGLGLVSTALISRENILCPACEGHRIHIPCTAAACLALINHVGFPLKGSHCVVIGRGRLVGAPTADLLVGPGGATVTQCHIHSCHLAETVASADLVVAAAGCPELVKGEWIKPGALVLDCGYNVVPDPNNPTKLRSVGDVQFEQAKLRAGWITPVPGGVGPISLAMLFRNTVNSARWTVGLGSFLCNCVNTTQPHESHPQAKQQPCPS